MSSSGKPPVGNARPNQHDRPDVTVIVPTRNEAPNVSELVRRLDTALGPVRAEVYFVDDSTDDTPTRIREIAAYSSRPIRLLHRATGQRTGGLGGAVVAGLRHARADWTVVMDADLQHPPERVPALLRAAHAPVDVVVASRYRDGGGADGLSSASRVRVSGWATSAVQHLFPQRLAGLTDPMSGFFAVRRSALDLERLRPQGFKILLEILVRTPSLRIAEVPFTFGDRLSGDSKASLREGGRFGRQVVQLWLATVLTGLRGIAARMLGFAAVGATGVAVNTLALWAFVDGLALHYLVGAAAATQVSTIWNFALTDAAVFRGRRQDTRRIRRFIPFALINNSALLLRLPLLALLVDMLDLNYLVGNVIVLLALFAVRFVVCERLIYRPEHTSSFLRTKTTNGSTMPGRHFDDHTIERAT